MKASRKAFCLGCGTTGETTVYEDGYKVIPQEVPGWCRESKCQKAKRKFIKLTNSIIYG